MMEVFLTLPMERRNAVLMTMHFLQDLLDPKKTPRVSRELRKRAYYCLKHYPRELDMEKARKLAPKIFGEWDSEYNE